MYPQSVSGTNSNVFCNSCPPPTHTPSLPAPLRGRNFALGWLGLLLYLTLISSLHYICMVAVASISLNLAFLYVLLFVYVVYHFISNNNQAIMFQVFASKSQAFQYDCVFMSDGFRGPSQLFNYFIAGVFINFKLLFHWFLSQLELLRSNLMWWCITTSWNVMQKDFYFICCLQSWCHSEGQYNQNMTVSACYLLNCWSFRYHI